MSSRAPRVGLFGLLGSGNIGNDASTEALMAYLRADHPGAEIDAMCMGWAQMRERYGIEAIPFQWQQTHQRSGQSGAVLKALGKVVDVVRTASWVRRHDVIIIPGMGIMDAALPINPWGVPYALYLLALAGVLFGTRVALVSVGASPARNRATRWLYVNAARMAAYRSFRDPASREALRSQGLDTTGDGVYPDLVFSAPLSPPPAVDPDLVGIGVMTYGGNNEDRGAGRAEIYAAYTTAMTEFITWLLDNGRRVRVFVGDEVDQVTADKIVADARRQRPDVDPARITGHPVRTAAELLRVIEPAATVVATRFHNIVFSLMLCKPTISIGYSPKNDSLMLDMELGEYCQRARAIDLELLKAQFTKAESHRAEITEDLRRLNAEQTRRAREQFAKLSRLLLAG
jgi:polysaccharide pyruvyl transferase WcaK-like protein